MSKNLGIGLLGGNPHGLCSRNRMTMNLVIHAPNVHVGGGLVLLAAILDAMDETFSGSLILHEQMSLPENFPKSVPVYRIRATPFSRFYGEWRFRRMVDEGDMALCFGNLPPLFKLRGKVFLFVQNRYLIEKRSLSGFPRGSRIRIMLERLWFAWGRRNVDCFLVQTPSMQRSMKSSVEKTCSILPFSGHYKSYERSKPSKPVVRAVYDFLYVASGEPHKNHQNLIEAWILLSKEGIHPRLLLTLETRRFPDLCSWIEGKKGKENLQIENRGNLSRENLQALYGQTRALIYPSDFESLGIPLIEARRAGLSILASERDYVRDIVDPEETFDPGSPVSIARAVKRFLGIPEEPLPVMDGRLFLSRVYEMAKR